MNKEIEELLNILKKCAREEKATLKLNEIACKTILSYIEQLDTNYKEANESVTWWQNRYYAIVKQNDDNHKKVVKLENNIDKAIEYVEEKGRLKYNPNELIDILKGDSDV